MIEARMATSQIPAATQRDAVSEIFFVTLKSELIEGASDATGNFCRQTVFEYMEISYNRTRMHSSPNYRSPAQAESENLANTSVI